MEPTREKACQQRIAELEGENASLRAEVADLKAQVAALIEQNADFELTRHMAVSYQRSVVWV